MPKKKSKEQSPVDNQAPATKQDIGFLMERLGLMEQDIHDLKKQREADKIELKSEITSDIKLHFNVVVENLLHDRQMGFAA